MNNLLIEKLIRSNNEPCPEFAYTNPLLDRNVTNSLTKSLVKMLKISTQNSNINNNLRLSVLENIRKLCVVQPENHLKVNENVTELLLELYEKQILESVKTKAGVTEMHLDNFLLTNYKELNLSSTIKSTQNPEILQALLNFDENKYSNLISKTITQWNVEDDRFLKLAKDLSNNFNKEPNLQNMISLKMKSEIEKNLLEIACYVLENKVTSFENVLLQFPSIINLINNSVNSYICFQMCCSIFNYVYITMNFDLYMHTLIHGFIKKIQSLSLDKSISFLYPTHLIHIVVLIDIELCNIPLPFRESYIKSTTEYLKQIHMDNETDLIMLLSHFPKWFDIYFS